MDHSESVALEDSLECIVSSDSEAGPDSSADEAGPDSSDEQPDQEPLPGGEPSAINVDVGSACEDHLQVDDDSSGDLDLPDDITAMDALMLDAGDSDASQVFVKSYGLL